MKYIITLIVSLSYATLSFGQTDHPCDTAYLNSEVNLKNAEPCVLKAAEYILTQPLHGANQQTYGYRSFVIAWMVKTPDFTFSLNDKMMAICKDDDNLLLFGIYNTCLAKAAVQLKTNFNKEAIKLFVDYISNPDNKVKQTSKVKKLMGDYKANNIEKYIN